MADNAAKTMLPNHINQPIQNAIIPPRPSLTKVQLPPNVGIEDPISAQFKAINMDIILAIINETMRPEPAILAPKPKMTKIPASIVEPIPNINRSKNLTFFSTWAFCSFI